jgi:hypothetical protein
MIQNKVGDLVHCGFCLGMIIKKDNHNFYVEWYHHTPSSLETKFTREDILVFKDRLKSEYNKNV